MSTINSSLASDSDNEIYERHLGLKQRGFPLWVPEPNGNLPIPYRRKGVDIGDVGIITSFGGFSFLFNICLPHDNPVNPSVLPEDFVPIKIDPMDVHEYPVFKPMSYLASTYIDKTRNEPPFRGLSFAIPSEGAVLTLPDGAIARDLQNVGLFREYAQANIESWYRFANGPRGRAAKNGDLRLVIGCDKATSWGMAVTSTTQDTCLKYRSVENHSAPLYEWDDPDCMCETKVGPDLSEIAALKRNNDSEVVVDGKYRNQCLFVRTLNITLSDDAFAKIIRDLKSAEPRSMNWVLHPADILNKRILQQSPTSRMVITQDKDWCSVVRKDDRSMPIPFEIAENVLTSYDIKEEHGITFLELKDSQSSLFHRKISSRYPRSHRTDSSLISLDPGSLRTEGNWSLISEPQSGFPDSNPPDKFELFKERNSEDVVIVLMGLAGTGKSSFINTLFGREVTATNHGLDSCTQDVCVFKSPYPGQSNKNIFIIDTPGFDDTARTDYEILQKIADWLARMYGERVGLSGFLYFHAMRGATIRRTPRTFEILQQLCGTKALKNVVLLSTFWDQKTPEVDKSSLERQLKEAFGLDKVSRFDDQTSERAWEIVDQFSSATYDPLNIQSEMVDHDKKLSETSAFQFLVHWWTQFLDVIGSKKQPFPGDLEKNNALRQMAALMRGISSPASSISEPISESTSPKNSTNSKPLWFKQRRKQAIQ